MANSKANGASRTVVWVLLLLLILGLGGFGAVSFSGNIRSVGKVGDTPIAVSRYQRQLSQDLRVLQQQTGMNFGIAEATTFGLDRAALAKVVAQVALENEAAKMGVSVGDAEVHKRMTAIGDFQGFDGKFDPEAYRDVLNRAGISVGAFEDEIRATAARALLANAVGAGIEMPKTMVDRVYDWAGERRSFVWVELSASDLAEPIREPTDADLKAWYDAHGDLYTLPEARRITYVWITPTMLVDKVEVDEDALRKLYDSRAAEYQQPERRLVERLVFATEDEARAALEAIAKGDTDFETLVTGRGLTLDDINLDEVSEDDLGAAGPVVFALTEPGLAGPAMTDLGPAIFRVNAILEATNTPYEEVRDELKDAYATDRARRMIQDMSEQINDLLAEGATLEDVARETDLELGTVDYTDAVSEDLAGYAAFRQAAVSVTADDFPEAIALDDGGLFALRLDQIIAPRLQDQADVQARVIEDWEAAETRTALEALADELLPRIRSGEDPASFGLSVNHEDALTRDAFLADVPEGLVAKAFELAPGEAARIAGTEGTPTVALVRTDEVLPPDPENSDLLAAREDFARQLDAQLAADLQEAFTSAVREAAGTTIDQSAIDAVNAAFQ